MPSRAQFALLVALLLAGFFLRVHNPAIQAAFIDESRHIERGQIAYSLSTNPVEIFRGKLLLYYWLGFFQPTGPGALVVSRLAVAIAALLSHAATVAMARTCFGRRAMLPAALFMVALPYDVFYSRLALADPLATALATLTVWQAVLLARHPTRRRGVIVGELLGATTLAKLTTAALLAIPVMAIALLGTVPLEGWTRAAIDRWNAGTARRYGPALKAISAVYLAMWGVIGLLSLYSWRFGSGPLIVDFYLIGLRDQTGNKWRIKLDTFWDILTHLVSAPMVALLIALVLVLLWKRRAATVYVLGWLALVWGPSMVFGIQPEARYMMLGGPPLAILFGGGMILAGDWLADRWPAVPRRAVTAALVLVVVGAWGAGFALPFAHAAMTDPEAVELPELDAYIFFTGPTNTWGFPEALDVAGQMSSGGDPVPVVGAFETVAHMHGYCEMFALYVPEALDWACVYRENADGAAIPESPAAWPELANHLARHPAATVIANALDPDSPPADPARTWTPLHTIERMPGNVLTVWRVTAN